MSTIVDTTRYSVFEEWSLLAPSTNGITTKFWRCALCFDNQTQTESERVSPYVVAIHWGRTGMSGSSTTRRFRSKSAAENYMAGRLRDKSEKGYQKVAHKQGGQPVELGSYTESQVAAPKAPVYVETEWDLL